MKNYRFITATLFVLGVFALIGWSCLAEKIVFSCGPSLQYEFDFCKEHSQAWARQTGHEVVNIPSMRLTNDALGFLQQTFYAKSDELDVVRIDVVWPGLIGKHLVDLQQYIDTEHINQHFKGMVENNRDEQGRLLGIPFYSNVGLLYYRKDLLEKHKLRVPATWDELKTTAEFILKQERPDNPNLVGYVWQGKSYEGLTCNALEWINSFKGGTIVDEKGEITINNPNSVKALETAASWIGGISPKEVLNFAEEDASNRFIEGNAIFLRNWNYVWALAQKPESKIKGKVGVAALPRGGKHGRHSATLGGWSLAVSKYSKHPKIAADLLKYMTSQEFQLEQALRHSRTPSITALYKHPKIMANNPYMWKIYETEFNVVSRPSQVTGRRYAKVSHKFWKATHSVLSGQNSAKNALATLEKDLQRIKGKQGW